MHSFNEICAITQKIFCIVDLPFFFGLFIIFKQSENRALRLRDGVTVSHLTENNLSASTSNSHYPVSSALSPVSQLSWDYFDEQGYIKRGGLRNGEDPYIRNRFNQQASDLLPSNRDIPDTRNPM